MLSKKTVRPVSRDPAIIAVRVVLGILFLGVSVVVLEGCSVPPEQPDLNTYGAIQPLCVLGCRITFTLSEGDGAQGAITSTITETSEVTR